MPIVPMVERTVERQGMQVPTPQYATPVKMAYTGIADANVEASAKLSQMAGGVADKVVQNNLWQEQARIYDSREKLANDVTGILSSAEMQTIKDAQGKEYQVPSGILNRQGFAAQGAGAEFMAKASALREDYVSQFKMPQLKRQAARMFDNIVASGYRQAMSHEGEQIKKATSDTFFNSAMNEVKLAGGLMKPEDLQVNLNNIQESYTRYAAFRGMDPESLQKGLAPLMAKAIQNSANNVMQNTGSLEQATAILDSAKDRMAPDDYNKSVEQLKTGAISMEKQATRLNDIEQNKNALDSLQGVINGNFGWKNINDIDNVNMPENFKVALRSAFLNRAEYTKKPGEMTMDNLGYVQSKSKPFFTHLVDLMKAGDQEKVVTAMGEALNNFGHGKMSQQDMNTLARAAIMQGSALPVRVDAEEGVPVNPDKVPAQAGMKALMDWSKRMGFDDPTIISSYMDQLDAGKTPAEAHDEAIKAAVIQKFPEAVTRDGAIANYVIPKGSEVKAVFNKNTTVYPQYIWDPKSKMFVTNPNREKSSKDKL